MENKSGRGGKRLGAGRPLNSGKYRCKTKTIRVPVDFNSDNLQHLQVFSDAFVKLENIIHLFKTQAELAKRDSKSKDYPERHKKCLRLISLLEEELSNLPIIL